MPVIEGTGLGTPLANAGAPVAGTDELQTLDINATGGTFRLGFDGFRTAPITWSAVNATLQGNIDAALEALPNIGTGGVAVAVGTAVAGVGTFTITFSGANLAKRAQPTITVVTNALTGVGTLTVVETTPGVGATGLGAPKGAKLVDTTNGIDYINTGTAAAPTWTKTGTQT